MTLAHPVAQAAPSGVRPQRVRRPAGTAGLNGVRIVVVALVLLQRFVVPGTSISVTLPIVFAVLAFLVVFGHVQGDATRFTLYALALAMAVLAAFTASATGLPFSLGSLVLLAATYLPCCCRATGRLADSFPTVLRFFCQVMVLPAVACCGQWVAQMAGWQFEDLLSFVPPGMLASTDEFNLTYPIYFGSEIYKANGVIFLEPSFASQFLALAILVQLMFGGAWWKTLLFGLGLLATLSGTGLVLLGCGIAVLAVYKGRVWAMRALVVLGLAVAVVAATPVGTLLADRSNESSEEGSSGNARFVAPYGNVMAAVSRDLPALAVGRGPGSVNRDDAFFNPRGVEVNYPAVPKLVAEYGLPAAAVFLAFILVVLFRRVPSTTFAIIAALLFLVLSSSLLQPTIVYLGWLLTGLFAAGDKRIERISPTARRSVGGTGSGTVLR